MLGFLAGVPGKLKAIYTHLTTYLTAERAGYLDNLNATISSRAAASTALSTATWTSARAAKLDGINAPVTSLVIGGYLSNDSSSPFSPAMTTLGAVSAASEATMYSVSGAGELAALGVMVQSMASGESFVCNVYVDGTLVLTATSTYAYDTMYMSMLGNLVTYWNGTAVAKTLTPGGLTIRFSTSLEIKGYYTGGACYGTAKGVVILH